MMSEKNLASFEHQKSYTIEYKHFYQIGHVSYGNKHTPVRFDVYPYVSNTMVRKKLHTFNRI